MASMPAQKPDPRPRLRVGFVLARRFTLCAFANFVDVLRLSADEGDRSRPILCDWRVLSATMEPIVSSSGISIQPEERLGDPARFDYIVVVGGLIGEIENLHPDHVRFLHRAAALGIPLVGVCTGAFILYRAGLMSGYRCCVSWFHRDDFLERFEGMEPVADQIFVVDRDRLTCSGGVSSAHLAAFLVDRHVGRAVAQKSLHIMIIDDADTAETPQPGIPLDLHSEDFLVKRALLAMQQHIDTPLTIEEIAERVGSNRRRLERRFRSRVGCSPASAYKAIRLRHAEYLLSHSDKPITAIAVESGYCDSSHFIRAFRESRGMTPSAYRGQTPAAG